MVEDGLHRVMDDPLLVEYLEELWVFEREGPGVLADLLVDQSALDLLDPPQLKVVVFDGLAFW